MRYHEYAWSRGTRSDLLEPTHASYRSALGNRPYHVFGGRQTPLQVYLTLHDEPAAPLYTVPQPFRMARITVSLRRSSLIQQTPQTARIVKQAPPPRRCTVSEPAFRARDSVQYWSVSEGVQGLRTRLRALDRRMIDITQETLIPLREAPRRLPPRPSGKRVHISACYRWISRGVRGVHLEAIRIGGSTYTSLEALQRFADHLGAPGATQTTPEPRQTRARQRQIDQASKRLRDALGFKEEDGVPAADKGRLDGGDKGVPRL